MESSTQIYSIQNLEHFCGLVKNGDRKFMDVLEEIEYHTGGDSDLSIEFCIKIQPYIIYKSRQLVRECRASRLYSIDTTFPMPLKPNTYEENIRQPNAIDVRDQKPKRKRSGNQASWAARVKKRDGNACKRCGSQEELHAHHIVSHWENPDNWDLNNGITLCQKCHKEYHAFFGH